ncbi:MAG: hypothetical protein H6Q66_1992 [Firmicutes bacterium]|nr:hypothetical protein [Bacillota bacterium]
MSDISLLSGSKIEYGDSYQQHLLEQYKIYVEMADRISQRRMTVNTFFITLNSIILTILGLFKNNINKWFILIAAVGLITSLAWFYILNSYRQLNSGKFAVIHELEKSLPASLYAYEWSLLENGTDRNNYWPISHVEKLIPVIFGLFYITGGIVLFILC